MDKIKENYYEDYEDTDDEDCCYICKFADYEEFLLLCDNVFFK